MTTDLQAQALAYITSALLETGKAPTMAQLRDHLGLKSRNSAHTIVLALEAAGQIVVTRFKIELPGMGPATYEEGVSDGRAQGLASLDVLPGEEQWARDVIAKAKAYRDASQRSSAADEVGARMALIERAASRFSMPQIKNHASGYDPRLGRAVRDDTLPDE